MTPKKVWKASDAWPSGAQEDGRALGRRALLGGAAGALAAPSVLAQPGAGAWPHDRVTIVTSLPAGSTVDVTTRVFADRLAQVWGKPIVIDNRGGANGVVACEMVARARPDGLTLLSTSAMTHAANPALYERLSYDPIRDFAAIGRYNTSPPCCIDRPPGWLRIG